MFFFVVGGTGYRLWARSQPDHCVPSHVFPACNPTGRVTRHPPISLPEKDRRQPLTDVTEERQSLWAKTGLAKACN